MLVFPFMLLTKGIYITGFNFSPVNHDTQCYFNLYQKLLFAHKNGKIPTKTLLLFSDTLFVNFDYNAV